MPAGCGRNWYPHLLYTVGQLGSVRPLAPDGPLRHTRGMRKYRTDYLLWGLIAGLLFLGLSTLIFTARDWTPEARVRFPADALNLAFWSAVFGWVFHAVAVMCGVRLSRRDDPGVQADYDDNTPDSPPGG